LQTMQAWVQPVEHSSSFNHLWEASSEMKLTADPLHSEKSFWPNSLSYSSQACPVRWEGLATAFRTVPCGTTSENPPTQKLNPTIP
jgi:hypothetical protein